MKGAAGRRTGVDHLRIPNIFIILFEKVWRNKSRSVLLLFKTNNYEPCGGLVFRSLCIPLAPIKKSRGRQTRKIQRVLNTFNTSQAIPRHRYRTSHRRECAVYKCYSEDLIYERGCHCSCKSAKMSSFLYDFVNMIYCNK